jgi:hypothetical protein
MRTHCIMAEYSEIWHLLTLVDITQTGDLRGTGKARNQQRNFDTVQQIVNMLAQPFSLAEPTKTDWGQVHRKFKEVGTTWGEIHDFTQETLVDLDMWMWRFGIEQSGVLDLHERYDGKGLLNIFDNVPVVVGLDENAVIQPPVFSITEKLRNILLICENRS